MLGEAPPFLVVQQWSEATKLVSDLLGDSLRLQALQDRCLMWYESYKDALARRVAARLLGSP